MPSSSSLAWQDLARCRGANTDLFFGRGGRTFGVRAKRICARCQERAVCLEWAITTRQDFGVWGGMNERERRLERYRRERLRRQA